jgi:hypothetical protein
VVKVTAKGTARVSVAGPCCYRPRKRSRLVKGVARKKCTLRNFQTRADSGVFSRSWLKYCWRTQA